MERASLEEDEHTSDESREMATDIMATSTTKLAHSIILTRFIRFALASLKMCTISLRSAQDSNLEVVICGKTRDGESRTVKVSCGQTSASEYVLWLANFIRSLAKTIRNMTHSLDLNNVSATHHHCCNIL